MWGVMKSNRRKISGAVASVYLLYSSQASAMGFNSFVEDATSKPLLLLASILLIALFCYMAVKVKNMIFRYFMAGFSVAISAKIFSVLTSLA
jgi:hypothetical protein